jgi:hypothetical protein
MPDNATLERFCNVMFPCTGTSARLIETAGKLEERMALKRVR